MVKVIFVGCIPYSFTKNDIEKTFIPFGDIKNIDFFEDKENASFDAYAHVTIETGQFSEMLSTLDGKHVNGRVLRVNELNTRQDNLVTPSQR